MLDLHKKKTKPKITGEGHSVTDRVIGFCIWNLGIKDPGRVFRGLGVTGGHASAPCAILLAGHQKTCLVRSLYPSLQLIITVSETCSGVQRVSIWYFLTEEVGYMQFLQKKNSIFSSNILLLVFNGVLRVKSEIIY